MSEKKQVIYANRGEAWLNLLTSEIISGKLYIRHYMTDENKLDFLLAYGVKNCNGYPESLESLKVIHGSSPFPVQKIVYEIPDVSEVAQNEQILYVDKKSDLSVEVSIIDLDEYSSIHITPFSDIEKKVFDMETGKYYFVSRTDFRCENDFGSTEEIEHHIEEALNEIRASIVELQQAVFPLSNKFTLTTKVAKTGTTRDIAVSYSATRKGVDVTPQCSNVITDNYGNTWELEDGLLKNVSSSLTFTLTSTFSPGYSAKASDSISFVYPTYWGKINKDILPESITVEMLEELIRVKSSYARSGINQNMDERIIFAYPKSYGLLTKILDVNNFENINNYSIHEVTFNSVPYYLYRSVTLTKITNLKQTYTY